MRFDVISEQREDGNKKGAGQTLGERLGVTGLG